MLLAPLFARRTVTDLADAFAGTLRPLGRRGYQGRAAVHR
jgi:hypothetical protein